ncbi:MAG TPA: response regulator transcription factor [Candidatus Avidesulfovibrio excrementigallinarum]|nr:response regulator transcription factor [Candidatus Avidesulfovibrio excrementigallinarum]
MRPILIIDDDTELCSLLRDYLALEGFACDVAHTGTEGLKKLAAPTAELVILDVMLPEKNGFEVLAELRALPASRHLPVIMLTARGDDVDRVVGLEMGADDYLPKPFNPRELLARIRAVLRRATPPAGQPPAPVVDVRLDEGAMRAYIQGRSVALTGQECRLLKLLLATPGELVPRERLYREVFGRAPMPFERGLDMQVSRLRKKLGRTDNGSERILAVRGEGYLYVLEGQKTPPAAPQARDGRHIPDMA